MWFILDTTSGLTSFWLCPQDGFKGQIQLYFIFLYQMCSHLLIYIYFLISCVLYIIKPKRILILISIL